MWANDYYTPGKNATVKCNGNNPVSLEALQKGGVELGSTNNGLPSNAQIIAWGREKLWGGGGD